MALPWRLGHDAMKVSSHVGDNAAESCWRRRIVKSIDVLLHRKEVKYSCVACSRVIAGKYHNLGTSLYDKNLTLLNVSTKGFAHKLART
jgi:hypothetical protein